MCFFSGLMNLSKFEYYSYKNLQNVYLSADCYKYKSDKHVAHHGNHLVSLLPLPSQETKTSVAGFRIACATVRKFIE